LIIFGVLILAKHWRGKAFSDQTGSSDSEADMINEFNVFSGSETIVSSQNFRGGKISSVFGGSKIDFSQAKLSQEYNEIELFYLFGGTELIVPSEWEIENRVTSIMGGFSHKRSTSVTTKPDSKQKLVLKGLVIFGGGEIKSL
jgi:predicted membrane protein